MAFNQGENGSYMGPAEKSTKSDQPVKVAVNDTAGLTDGIATKMAFDSEDAGPNYNYERDSLTGNATERPDPYPSEAVKSKGASFEIIG